MSLKRENKQIAHLIFSQAQMTSFRKPLTCPSCVIDPKKVQTQKFRIF